MLVHQRGVERQELGIVQRNHHVVACWDRDSLWVEIAGPKGGGAWQMAPEIARALAALLVAAAETESVSPDTLKRHYLAEIVCDHDRKMDNPVCACSLVNLGWHPSVGEAVDAWIAHVVEVNRGALDDNQAQEGNDG